MFKKFFNLVKDKAKGLAGKKEEPAKKPIKKVTAKPVKEAPKKPTSKKEAVLQKETTKKALPKSEKKAPAKLRTPKKETALKKVFKKLVSAPAPEAEEKAPVKKFEAKKEVKKIPAKKAAAPKPEPKEKRSTKKKKPATVVKKEKAVKPVPKAASEPTVEPEPLPEPASELKPNPEPEPVSESEPEPVPEPKPIAEKQAEEEKGSWLSRLKNRLTKTSSKVSEGINQIFVARKLDEATLEELEDLLITSDLGVETATRVSAVLAKKKLNKNISPEEVKAVLANEIAAILAPVAKDLDVERGYKPHIILMVGVNGTGKTTTIGKMAEMLKILGKSVMVAAGDTFRAAAIEQLEIWAERAGVPIIKGTEGGDAASVAYAAIDAAKAKNIDVLIIDTAGRLQNRSELMDELAKIVRVIKKKDETGPHDTILVLDATTGQNAIMQAQVFREAAEVSGIIMTKLDGTAKGGILVACTEKFGLPVYGIGVGERLEDLQPFDPDAFARALVGLDLETAEAAE